MTSTRLMSVLLPIAPVLTPTPVTAEPSQTSGKDDLSVCDALMTDIDVLGKHMEGQMMAMGQRLGKIANEGIADGQARNAFQSQVGKLNWVVPGLGTALDLINKSVFDAKAKKRQLQVDRERVAATLSVEQVVSRINALSNELILNDCAQL